MDEYLFLGWENEAGETIEEIGPHNICDMKLKAHWRPRELRYHIRYEMNGGTGNDENPTEAVSGTRVFLHDPQKTGYLFLGWYDNEEGQGERYEYIPEDQEKDIVLYAIWQEIITAGSADYFTYERHANSVKITGYTGPTGESIDLSYPAIIDGLPVTEISELVLRSNRIFLHSVTIPHSVTILGDQTFSSCTVTEPLMIPPEVERIESWTFSNFEGKICFAEHGNLTYIGESAFSWCTFDEPLVLPHGLETIASFAFNTIITDGVFLPDTIKTIGDDAFHCQIVRLTEKERADIYLPSSPTYIGKDAFFNNHVHTTLTSEQTAGFHNRWNFCTNMDYLGQKHRITLFDGDDSETLEGDYGYILPKHKKMGFTFLGWKNEQGEFVHNCYFPRADETLYAAYEEESPTDGRTEERAIPLQVGKVYEIPYISLQFVYFIWQGKDVTLMVHQPDLVLDSYLLGSGKPTKFSETCKCKKGDVIRIGGNWVLPGMVLKLSVTIS